MNWEELNKEKSSTFIIAELSANHNHDLNIALQTVKVAAQAGADAIKVQTYTPDTITIDSNLEYFKINEGTLWDGRTLYDLYKEAHMPWEWHRPIQEEASKNGLIFFSSPFDNTAVDYLENLKVPLYKIASFEITDIPLIKKVAKLNKPIIISTGIATIEDIELAVKTCYNCGNYKIALLKCTSKYPAPIEKSNLLTIVDMKDKFQVPIGLSDHTLGITAPVVAVSLGAKIIEKHLILDKQLGGPDAPFSLEPIEFRQMVEEIRNAEKALGIVTYDLDEKTKRSRKFARSLFVVEDINIGEVFTDKNIRSIRPSDGLHPKYLQDLIGKHAKVNISKGTPLSWDLVDN